MSSSTATTSPTPVSRPSSCPRASRSGPVREGMREPAKVNAPGAGRFDKTESQTPTQAPPPASPAEARVSAARQTPCRPHPPRPLSLRRPPSNVKLTRLRRPNWPTPLPRRLLPHTGRTARTRLGNFPPREYRGSSHDRRRPHRLRHDLPVPHSLFLLRDRRLPPQVAQRQSPEVDYVSGATQSADAFYSRRGGPSKAK